MFRVGLTGGIASGKSSVSAMLRQLGAQVVDHDVLAREAVAPGSDGLAAIERRFGSGVMNADGTLNRPALGAVVFSDERAREDLNAIVHPEVARLSDLADECSRGVFPVIVHDIPLLVEVGLGDGFEAVIVVEAPVDERVARMVRDRGMSADDARARIAAQASDAERRAVADFVVVNDAGLEELRARVAAVWRDIEAMMSTGQ